ncbi:hypothetical protein FDP41_013157 [Naegleria fowleri]|uniref:Uncharacterized protein n=1 Tax=Naegleria fowleri TaxID=5763 RepID=A0A6A5C297_NAEFO|nr:uncharacterized protein FDP41_013157 [Naegleria fowleri]KAF0980674.1 hypothetical protein FDP41_013157 [Naegleria fowleri]
MSCFYSPTSPYYCSELETSHACVTYSVPDELKQKIDQQVRTWGLLCQRDPCLSETNWGHVYVQVHSTLKKLCRDSQNIDLLLKPLLAYYDVNTLPYLFTISSDKLFTLPTHFTVISHLEWQRGFFELDKKVSYFGLRTKTSSSLSPLDIVYKYGNPLTDGYTKDITDEARENKAQHLLMFTYFKRSKFAEYLPDEIVQNIGSFLLFELHPQDKKRKINFRFAGLVTFAPNYVEYEKCLFLHMERAELDELRKKYGFHNKMDYVVVLGKLERVYCPISPACNTPCYSPYYSNEMMEMTYIDISESSDRKRKLEGQESHPYECSHKCREKPTL